jgi:hypothetical protein
MIIAIGTEPGKPPLPASSGAANGLVVPSRSHEPFSGLHAASSYSNNCGYIADIRAHFSIRPSEEAGHINV